VRGLRGRVFEPFDGFGLLFVQSTRSSGGFPDPLSPPYISSMHSCRPASWRLQRDGVITAVGPPIAPQQIATSHHKSSSNRSVTTMLGSAFTSVQVNEAEPCQSRTRLSTVVNEWSWERFRAIGIDYFPNCPTLGPARAIPEGRAGMECRLAAVSSSLVQ